MILEIGEMLQNFLAISGDELLQMKANEIKGRSHLHCLQVTQSEHKWQTGFKRLTL